LCPWEPFTANTTPYLSKFPPVPSILLRPLDP
jgi:hypothetical protein